MAADASLRRLAPSMTQTRIEDHAPQQNNYDRIIDQLEKVQLELVYLRHEWEDNKRDLFDNNEMIGLLAKHIRVQSRKIEEWVGVAEETG